MYADSINFNKLTKFFCFLLYGLITLRWHKLNKAHLLHCYRKKSYKNNCSLVQIATKNPYIQRHLTFDHKPAVFISWSICVKICNYFLSSVNPNPANTHCFSRKCTYTRHSKCNVLLVNCKVILVNQTHTVTSQGNKVHDLNRAVVHNTAPAEPRSALLCRKSSLLYNILTLW